MAKNEIRNGQAEYGIRHVMEEEMRAAGQGVFAAKNAGNAPSNKARKAAPEDKALSGMTKAELIDAAEAEGVTVETDDTKADLVEKIEKARK